MTDIHWQDDPGAAPPAEREPIAPPRDAVRALETAAPLVQFGLIAIGVIYALEYVSMLVADRPSLSDDNRMTLRVNFVVTLLWYGGLGLAAGRLLSALARLVESQREQAATAARTARWYEHTLSPALARLTEALERSRANVREDVRPPEAAEELNEVRRGLAAGDWLVAEQRVRAFVEAHPAHPDAARLTAEVDRGREAATHEMLARLDAARAASDPERALELRATLAQLLSGEPLRSLDRDLAKWFLHLIQKRLRAGPVRPDVPQLAARIADALDTTPEGASLRASLPTLRRSAGLCARCAEPYAGIADACPKCVATTSLAASPPPPSDATPEVDGEDEALENTNGRADDPFLRDDLE